MNQELYSEAGYLKTKQWLDSNNDWHQSFYLQRLYIPSLPFRIPIIQFQRTSVVFYPQPMPNTLSTSFPANWDH
jgi:hypothetical protein